MALTDLSITIGGDAGQGVESSGATLSLAAMRSGWYVFSIQDYRSRIRGGHNFYQIRIASRAVRSHSDPVHLLLALTKESVDIHRDNLAPGAGVLYDDSLKVDEGPVKEQGCLLFPMPLTEIAERHGNRVMTNTAAVAAGAGVLGLSLERLKSVVEGRFAAKGPRVVEANLRVADDAYRMAVERFRGAFRYALHGASPPLSTRDPGGNGGETLLISGNEAFALGAAAGGCRFVSAYPMTPATTIFEWLVRKEKKLGIVTKHAEDEIAAVCMAIGAGYAGARALVPTSGGGFSLMVEALGMAGMTEVPVVIVDVQRGGPSTGLPTRTEQGDLLFVLHASQGEFPRIVLAPGTHEEYFEAGWRSFTLAERYQCPVIVLADQFLAASLCTLPSEALSFDAVVRDRGELLDHAALDKLEPGQYRRYRITSSGISPRALPGHPNAVYTVVTDEHDEEGHITEAIENRVQQMSKRMRKLEHARQEMRGPKRYGPEDADLTLICWGSAVGPVVESLPLLEKEGVRANALHFTDIGPFPADQARRALEGARRTVAVEQNYTGQFAKLLRMCTGHEVSHGVHKFDGRPFSPQQIASACLEEVASHV